MLPQVIVIAGLALQSPGGLRWHAPAQRCPSEAEVVSRLDALVEGATLSTVAAEARVLEHDARWHLDLDIRWGEGRVERRQLDADTCEELAEAALVLFAILAEPTGRETAREPSAGEAGEGPGEGEEAAGERRPAESSVAAVDVEDVIDVEDVVDVEDVEDTAAMPGEAAISGTLDGVEGQRSRSVHPRRLSLMGGALGDYGALALPALGLRLGLVGALGRRLRLVVEGRYLPPRTTASDATYSRSGRLQLGYAHLGACANVSRGRLSAPLCAAVELGGLRADGFGEDGGRGARDLWLALAASGSVAVRVVPRLSVVVGVEVAAALVRQRYTYGADRLYETALPGARLLIGLEIPLADQIPSKPENP